MVTEKPTVKIYPATYIGFRRDLKGKSCLVMCRSDDEENLLAQFARTTGARQFAYGWHAFPRNQFDIDYFNLDGRL